MQNLPHVVVYLYYELRGIERKGSFGKGGSPNCPSALFENP